MKNLILLCMFSVALGCSGYYRGDKVVLIDGRKAIVRNTWESSVSVIILDSNENLTMNIDHIDKFQIKHKIVEQRR